MDLVKTNILYIEKINKYKVDLWFYTKYFEYLIFAWKKYSKFFWNKFDNILIDENFTLNNFIIWFTRFFDLTIVCFINLEDLSTDYIFFKVAYLYSYNIKWKDYLFFVYSDEFWNEKIFHNCNLEDFDIKFKVSTFQKVKTKCELEIINTEIWVSVFSKIIYFNENNIVVNLSKKLENKFDLSVVDLYFFDDCFLKIKKENNLLKIFDNKIFQVWVHFIKTKVTIYDNLYYPEYKIEFIINSEFIDVIDLIQLINFFLIYFPNQFVTYIIENDNFKWQFNNYFKNINTIEIEKFDLNFLIPQNIYEFDKDFSDFQENFIKLRYIYFNLKNNLELLNNNVTWTTTNLFLVFAKEKLSMNRESLEIMIKKYTEVLEKIMKIILK